MGTDLTGTVTPNTKSTSCCLLKADDHEPIFVLRAQDITAPTVVANWMNMNASNISNETRQSALLCILQMYEWQRANPTKVKRPD